MTGWKCPRCGTCWSPTVLRCTCNEVTYNEVTYATSRPSTIVTYTPVCICDLQPTTVACPVHFPAKTTLTVKPQDSDG